MGYKLTHGFGYGLIIPTYVEAESGVELEQFIPDNYPDLAYRFSGNWSTEEFKSSVVIIHSTEVSHEDSTPLLFNPSLSSLLPQDGLEELQSVAEFLGMEPHFGWVSWVYVS